MHRRINNILYSIICLNWHTSIRLWHFFGHSLCSKTKSSISFFLPQASTIIIERWNTVKFITNIWIDVFALVFYYRLRKNLTTLTYVFIKKINVTLIIDMETIICKLCEDDVLRNSMTVLTYDEFFLFIWIRLFLFLTFNVRL